ncbi:MAG: hypothetical protein R3272_02055 [Candidatus Promineifilaceae bacterium]|nr:hypothetical protein [Candidatus Promineifilaceae bacterium]
MLARFREHGSVLQGTKEGRCQGLEIELALESDEPQEVLRELLRIAHRMCFTEDVLSRELAPAVRHLVNGEPLAM